MKASSEEVNMELEHVWRDVRPDGGGAGGLIRGVVGWTDGEEGGVQSGTIQPL